MLESFKKYVHQVKNENQGVNTDGQQAIATVQMKNTKSDVETRVR